MRTNEELGLSNDGNEETTGMEERQCVGEYHDDGIGMVESPKKVQTETKKMDRDIIVWSSDKEIGIRLLLSTHIIFGGLRVAGLKFLIRAK